MPIAFSPPGQMTPETDVDAPQGDKSTSRSHTPTCDHEPHVERGYSYLERPDRAVLAAHARREPVVLVLGSGKGGAGASVLTVMCGAHVAQTGRRVLLLDGSQNLGNLHVLLGVPPCGSLHGVLTGAALPESLVQKVAHNLWLLPANSGDEAIYALSAMDRARLHYQLSTLYDGFDSVIVDAGPGLESVVRASAMGASRLVVVLLSDDSAITNSHALIKIVGHQLPQLPIHVIANRTHDPSEGTVAFEKLTRLCEGGRHRELDYLGSLPSDSPVRFERRTHNQVVELHAVGSAAEALWPIIADHPWIFGLESRLVRSSPEKDVP